MANGTLYLGAVGSGKTTLMRRHVDQIRREPDAPVFLIVDHAGEWIDLPGALVLTGASSWWRSPAPVTVFRGTPERDVAQLAIEIGWAVYVDDEVDALVHDGPWVGNPLREIIRRGRHLPNRAGIPTEVGAWIATQRPAGLPGDVTGLFDRVYLGRLFSAADVERVRREGWLVRHQGRPPASFQEVADELRARAPGTFSSWP